MTTNEKKNVVLIGGGIMSATLGTLIKDLEPNWNVKMFETLESPALESSGPWNNAGTGHSALCELNYTPEDTDGNIDITKAVNVNEKWQTSLQYWANLVKEGRLSAPEEFIKKVPHLSFVEGKDNVNYLRKRQEILKEHPLFEGMEFSTDPETLKEWMPLMMEGRESFENIAATYMEKGTDVNFGELTRQLFKNLQHEGVSLNYKHEVLDLKQMDDGKWEVKVKDLNTGSDEFHIADFVFIGAGGGSLPLLQKTKIPESKNIGGFPVSGLFLVAQDEEIVNKHEGKVYGKAKVGAPPMSVPHLDTRYIDGKKSLLFGPFAGFSPKFLKTGSYFDLIGSVKPNNVFTMLASGAKEMPLTKYLISQLMLSDDDRIEELREFVPTAKKEHWETIIAGQRVQVIKDTENEKGKLQFGTEVITSDDGSISALLGASPGASIAISVMLEVVQKCFPEEYETWEAKVKEMIPSYGKSLAEDEKLLKKLRASSAKVLGL